MGRFDARCDFCDQVGLCRRTEDSLICGSCEASPSRAELAAKVAALEARRDELLALVATLSRTAPYSNELEESRQRCAALIAEVGTLRARVAELERMESAWKRNVCLMCGWR